MAPDSPGRYNQSHSDGGEGTRAIGPTWENEKDARHKSQDGALRLDVSDVTDDESREDKEQRHHREGRGRPHHLCRGGEAAELSEAARSVYSVTALVAELPHTFHGACGKAVIESSWKMSWLQCRFKKVWLTKRYLRKPQIAFVQKLYRNGIIIQQSKSNKVMLMIYQGQLQTIFSYGYFFFLLNSTMKQ